MVEHIWQLVLFNSTTVYDGASSDTTVAVLRYVKGLAAKASGADKEVLEFFATQLERWAQTRTLRAEIATYPAGRQGNEHRDDEEEDLTNRNNYEHRGGEAKGYQFAGPIKFRLALPLIGKRSMSFFDTRGRVATIERSPGRGVCFVDGAHTKKRGVVEHRNDAGDEPGATLILTFRADASSAFENMTPAERLFAHAGVALFAAH